MTRVGDTPLSVSCHDSQQASVGFLGKDGLRVSVTCSADSP